MREVFMFGDYLFIDFQFLQESPFLTDLVEVKKSLRAGVLIPQPSRC